MRIRTDTFVERDEFESHEFEFEGDDGEFPKREESIEIPSEATQTRIIVESNLAGVRSS